ncbi:MAG: aminotransferase class III-fold pyridoxal phosphate-dependent enzyme [Candidatus Aminicenantes bacterium]|nr:aminotransferase class III-fold pyridoxal phosphate-dependent enzyme [Candidatus Aminicenantes bacterium]
MPYLTKAVPHLVDSIFIRGEGPYIWDHNDRRYLDFTSGIGVTNTGHCHPKVVAAIHEQADLLLHTHQNTAFHAPMLRVIQGLHGILPSQLDTFFFANCGAEAVESAVKLARQATKRPNIIAFERSFHGRTVGTMSLTASKTIYRAGYQPLMPGVFFAPYAYCYRCPKTEANPEKFGFEKDCNWTLEELDFILHSQTAPEETAAMIVEPILGEGGYIIPPKRFLQGLRKMCDEHGILLILDEIQSGFGRTGRYFAFEHFDIMPDILIMAKGLASGMPLSCIAASQEVMSSAIPGSHGGTYGGNAVACAAAAASIKVYKEENLLENATKLGKKLLDRLQEFKTKYPMIGDVRGLGLMAGVEFVKPDGRTPDKEKAGAVKKACVEGGMLMLTCGTYDNIIRWIPPLIINEGHLEEGLNIFEQALEKTAKT